MIGDSTSYLYVVSDSVMGYIKADAAYGQFQPQYSSAKECSYKNKLYKCVDDISKKEITTYYFNDDVRIDPDKFRNIELFHWNKFFRATNGALRLISITRKRRSLIISGAIEITRMNIERMDFTVPAGYKVEEREGFKVYN